MTLLGVTLFALLLILTTIIEHSNVILSCSLNKGCTFMSAKRMGIQKEIALKSGWI